MPKLSIILIVIALIAAVITLDVRWERTTHDVIGSHTTVNRSKTILLKLAFGTLAVLCGWLAGYVAGWWF